MSHSLIVLTPLLILSVVVLFAFAGCGEPFTSGEPPTPTTPETYEGAIEATTGLVAYWRLGETKLPPDPYPPAADEGPNKLAGTYKGAVALAAEAGALATTEPADAAPDFNGQDSYMEVAWTDALNLPLSFSVEAWIRPAAFVPGMPSVQQVVAFRDIDPDALTRGFELTVVRQPDPNPRIQGRVGTGGTTELAAEVVFALPDDQLGGPNVDWRHVMLSYEGAPMAGGPALRLFVDGDLKHEKLTTDDPNLAYTANGQQPLRIGAGRTDNSPDPAEFYAGAIDEVALYGVALDKTVATQHYQLSGR
ncbi:MAG: LamG domain-containing protein [Thermoleophilaceae bacterium]